MMDDYDKQKDIDAEGQRAAIFHQAPKTVTVPREVLEFFEFCDHAFVPFDGQQEELMISLRKARVAMGRPEYAPWERERR